MTGVPRRARCLIVDDEAPARAELRFLLESFPDVQVVGEASNAEEAAVLLDSLDYDVVLLDIRMPGGTGLDLARRLRGRPDPPAVVFTTAYPDHAVEAFDLAAADYLVKPFDADRLERALRRALRTGADIDAPADAPAAPSATGSSASDAAGAAASSADETATASTPMSSAASSTTDRAGPSPASADEVAAASAATGPTTGEATDTGPQSAVAMRVPVQHRGRTVLINPGAIYYASAARGYSYLKLADERVLTSYTLAELERRLGPRFFRCHRSYLVNLRHVRELVSDYQGSLVLVMDDTERSRVEVSRRQSAALRRALGI